MASENRDPTGDTGTETDITDIGTQRLRAARDLVADVADVADVAATETEITAEEAVGGGAMVQTPNPPTKTKRKLRVADRTDAKEVDQRRRDDGLRGMGKPPWGQPSAPTGEGGYSHLDTKEEGETSMGPAIRRPQEKVGPAIGAHRTLVRPAITALTVRSAIGAHRILVRHAMRRLQ